MGTRTNIIVKHGSTKIYFYRHYDGYPAATGADLVEKLRDCETDIVGNFVAKLLAERYESTSYKQAQPVYELTTEVHGDIEYVYCIEFPVERGVRQEMMASCVHRQSGEDPDVAAARAEGCVGHVNRLIGTVNRDRKEINARLKELAAKYPAGGYGDAEAMPMLAEQ